MKKYLILFCLSIACLSCQKKYCWKCTLYGPNSAGTGLDLTKPTNNTQCDMSKSDISNYEKAHTKTIRVNNGTNYQQNTVESAKCTQQ